MMMPDHCPRTHCNPLLLQERLSLPQVTVCAVSSVNLAATIRALTECIAQVAFAETILFTDTDVQPDHPGIRVEPIERLASSAAYSDFVLRKMVDRVTTSHCLVVQWDGHIIDATRWQPEFLNYDYVGAGWPQFDDGHDVGNGGFSLRSKRLMEACRAPGFAAHHPEDLAIGRTNRAWLEAQGLRFAPRDVADLFAAERAGDPAVSFGYHGVFLMPRVLGAEGFWQIYRTLDDRSSLQPDFVDLLRMLITGHAPFLRLARMIGNWIMDSPGGAECQRHIDRSRRTGFLQSLLSQMSRG